MIIMLPELAKEFVKQKYVLLSLIVGLIMDIILFAIVIWYNLNNPDH